ncbi:MAG: histidine phosphatase family protein [Acidimicrobiales bacterium]
MSVPARFRTLGGEPSGARLLLVRHGEAVCNVAGVVGGARGCTGLSDRGRAQARALGERLRMSGELGDVVTTYVSPLARARETADLVRTSVPGLPPARVAPDLEELRPGEADGLTWAQLVARFGGPNWDEDPGAPLAPGGESWLAFSQRCRVALEELARAHPGERVVLFTHAGVIEHALRLVFPAPAGARLGLRTTHCSMTEVEVDGARRRLLRYNDVAPVP